MKMTLRVVQVLSVLCILQKNAAAALDPKFKLGFTVQQMTKEFRNQRDALKKIGKKYTPLNQAILIEKGGPLENLMNRGLIESDDNIRYRATQAGMDLYNTCMDTKHYRRANPFDPDFKAEWMLHMISRFICGTPRTRIEIGKMTQINKDGILRSINKGMEQGLIELQTDENGVKRYFIPTIPQEKKPGNIDEVFAIAFPDDKPEETNNTAYNPDLLDLMGQKISEDRASQCQKAEELEEQIRIFNTLPQAADHLYQEDTPDIIKVVEDIISQPGVKSVNFVHEPRKEEITPLEAQDLVIPEPEPIDDHVIFTPVTTGKISASAETVTITIPMPKTTLVQLKRQAIVAGVELTDMIRIHMEKLGVLESLLNSIESRDQYLKSWPTK